MKHEHKAALIVGPGVALGFHTQDDSGVTTQAALRIDLCNCGAWRAHVMRGLVPFSEHTPTLSTPWSVGRACIHPPGCTFCAWCGWRSEGSALQKALEEPIPEARACEHCGHLEAEHEKAYCGVLGCSCRAFRPFHGAS